VSKLVAEDEFNENELFTDKAFAAPKSSNPLAAYFRLPGCSVKLPTGGVFFPEGGVELDEAGEVKVLPMRAADELLLSSPDALMNNSAVMSLIASCVPAIKMPELVSAPDLDVLLLAIRVASSGDKMDVELVCPKCDEKNPYEVDLPSILQTITPVPAINEVRLSDDMVVYLRPHTVKLQTKILIAAFKERRIAQAMDMNESATDEERDATYKGVMARLAEMNTHGVACSIIKIIVPGAEVSDQGMIEEFLVNTDSRTLNRIRAALETINNMGADKTVPATCGDCGHEWAGSIEFNPATFFEERSSD
jgi:hypothetical protein